MARHASACRAFVFQALTLGEDSIIVAYQGTENRFNLNRAFFINLAAIVNNRRQDFVLHEVRLDSEHTAHRAADIIH